MYKEPRNVAVGIELLSAPVVVTLPLLTGAIKNARARGFFLALGSARRGLSTNRLEREGHGSVGAGNASGTARRIVTEPKSTHHTIVRG